MIIFAIYKLLPCMFNITYDQNLVNLLAGLSAVEMLLTAIFIVSCIFMYVQDKIDNKG